MSHRVLFLLPLLFANAASADWLSHPSTYTHSPVTGQRVDQYQAIAEPTGTFTPISSGGFHHTRSTLNYGKSADNYFRVERWGEPVQPFAAFRFPFRPYGTPYPNWGPPYGGLGTDIQIGPNVTVPPNMLPGAGGNIDNGFPGTLFRGGGFGGVGLGRNGFSRGSLGNFHLGRNPGFGSPTGAFQPFIGNGFQQPISPLVPYPSVPLNPDRVSPVYDGHYPTYRD